MRDDHEFNIHFVKLIEKERCLYDKSLPEYRSKDMHEQIWRQIAAEVNDSGKYQNKIFYFTIVLFYVCKMNATPFCVIHHENKHLFVLLRNSVITIYSTIYYLYFQYKFQCQIVVNDGEICVPV